MRRVIWAGGASNTPARGINSGGGGIVMKKPTFAARLRTLREAAGLSIPDLAAKCSMPRQTVHRLERSERAPSWETVQRLAKALGVRPNDFE